MRCLLGAALSAVLAVALVLHASRVSADEMRWSMSLTAGHAVTSVADATAGREVGVLTISGKAEIAGESADVSVFVMIDYTNGSGPWQLYMTVAFPDDSVLTTYGTGLTQADARDGDSRFQGPLTVIGGTGRYAGAHGGGTMLGRRAAPVGEAVTIQYEIALDLQK